MAAARERRSPPRRWVMLAVSATVMVAVTVATFGLLGSAGLAGWARLTIAVLAGTALVPGALLILGSAFQRSPDGHGEDPDLEALCFSRRVDAYRAVLEAAIAREAVEQDEPFLRHLRERFGITADQDEVLRHLGGRAAPLGAPGMGAGPGHEGSPGAGTTHDGPDRGEGGRYERLRLMGESAGGRTWLARDHVRDRLVVVEEPLGPWHQDPSLVAGVQAFAERVKALDHPNLAQVLALEMMDDARPMLVIEHIDGCSVAELIEAHGPLSIIASLDIAERVLDALAALHRAGIVHGSLRPTDVLVTPAGDVRVRIPGAGGLHLRGVGASDTQVAGDPEGRRGEQRRGRDDPLGPRRQTRLGSGGSGARDPYVAPEAENAPGRPRPPADVFAWGALVHVCLTGQPPPVHGPPAGAGGDPDDPRGALFDLVRRSLAPRAGDRFEDAVALQRALGQLPRPTTDEAGSPLVSGR